MYATAVMQTLQLGKVMAIYEEEWTPKYLGAMLALLETQ